MEQKEKMKATEQNDSLETEIHLLSVCGMTCDRYRYKFKSLVRVTSEIRVKSNQ